MGDVKISRWNIRRTVFQYFKKRIASTENSNSPNAVPVGFRVEAAGYPAAPPTDPYLKISLIRFLSSNLLETKQALPRLAHNFATLPRENYIECTILGTGRANVLHIFASNSSHDI